MEHNVESAGHALKDNRNKVFRTMSTVSIKTKWIRLSAPALAAALTFTVFLPALHNGFVNWDDFENLRDNYFYRGLGWTQLKWMFTTFHMGPYQPLTWMSFGLDYLIWGMSPFGYHLTSVVLHSLNALLSCLIFRRLLAAAVRPETAPSAEIELAAAAVFAALFFAVHPLRVESVAWATERRDVLSGFFYLLTVLLYLIPRSAGDEDAGFWRRHALPAAACLLALLSKGMAVSLPVVLILLDIYPLGRLPADPRKWFSRATRPVWLEKTPYLLLAAVFGAAGYIGQAMVGGGIADPEPGAVGRAVLAAAFYIRKTLFPFHLSPLYKVPGGSELNRLLWLSGAALSAITAGVVLMRRRWPAGAAVWFYYLAVLAPVLGVLQFGHQMVGDRYSYLPCLGFAALFGAGLLVCLRTRRWFVKPACSVIACLIITALAALTWRQEKVWRDSWSLWSHTAALQPELGLARVVLGGELAARGDLAGAADYFKEAIRISPGTPTAHYCLGNILLSQGKAAEAAAEYREELRRYPDYAAAHNNLANALAGEEAIRHYREALRLNPDFAEAHYNLGGALIKRGDYAEAAREYTEVLRINPNFEQARYKLKDLLRRKDAGIH